MVSSSNAVTPASRREAPNAQDSCCKRQAADAGLNGGNQDAVNGASSPFQLAGTNQKALDRNGNPLDPAAQDPQNPLAALQGDNLQASGDNLLGMMATVMSTVMLMVTTMIQAVLSQVMQNSPMAQLSSGSSAPAGQPGAGPGGPGGSRNPAADDPNAAPVTTTAASNLPASSLAERFSADRVSQLYADSARPNVQQYLPHILGALKEQGIDDPQMALYALATIKVESGSFKPINEYSGGYAYEGRADLGNTQPGDGHRFMGRGFIQLTGRSNYTSYGRELGVDLVGNPELANDPQIAARILALYLKRNEGRIRRALEAGDMAAARRVVNGGTNGLQGFTEAYRQGQQLGLA